MSTIPLFAPQCPFLGLIPGGLKVGHALRIRATITSYNSRCHINIQSGAALRPRDDTVLHLSIRPQENSIIRNHFDNQVWGNEERHGGMPIKWEDSFEITIGAEPSLFRIAIDGKHFCTFNYRLPISMAQFVSIDGGCTIQYINLDEPNLPYPNAPPAAPYHVGGTAVPPPTHHHVPPYAPVPIVPAPGYPQHYTGYPPQSFPPAPPPMPSIHSPPPPYGQYPPSPYSEKDEKEKQKKKDKKNIKVAAGVGAVAGLTAAALSSASKGLRKHRK